MNKITSQPDQEEKKKEIKCGKCDRTESPISYKYIS